MPDKVPVALRALQIKSQQELSAFDLKDTTAHAILAWCRMSQAAKLKAGKAYKSWAERTAGNSATSTGDAAHVVKSRRRSTERGADAQQLHEGAAT